MPDEREKDGCEFDKEGNITTQQEHNSTSKNKEEPAFAPKASGKKAHLLYRRFVKKKADQRLKNIQSPSNAKTPRTEQLRCIKTSIERCISKRRLSMHYNTTSMYVVFRLLAMHGQHLPL